MKAKERSSTDYLMDMLDAAQKAVRFVTGVSVLVPTMRK